MASTLRSHQQQPRCGTSDSWEAKRHAVIGRILQLGAWSAFYLHFCSNSDIAIFSRGYEELALFWINM